MVASATWRNTQDAEPGRGRALAWRGGRRVGSRRLWPHPVLAPLCAGHSREVTADGEGRLWRALPSGAGAATRSSPKGPRTRGADGASPVEGRRLGPSIAEAGKGGRCLLPPPPALGLLWPRQRFLLLADFS